MNTSKTVFSSILTVILLAFVLTGISRAQGSCDLSGMRTFTQGGWGSKGNSTPGGIRDAHFDAVFPTYAEIGGIKTARFTDAEAVEEYLPAGGTSNKFTMNYTDPENTSAGVLGGQILALLLNVKYDEAGFLSSNPLKLKDLVITSGTFAGMTVSDFLAIANAAIGGASTGYTYSQINSAATAINENFDDGTVNRGFLSCPPTNLPASLGDKVWFDTDEDGVQDAGETGVANVVVKLYNCNNTLVATTTTDASGNYLFSNLTAGSYYVEFVLPSGKLFTTQNSGSDDTKDSDADATTGKTTCYTLNSGDNNLTVDAGLKNPPPQVGSIGDKVWFDTDEDGVQDAGEAGVANVIVKLYNCNNTLVATTTTDANGNYLFSNLTAGSYYVQFVLPSGKIFTTQNSGSDDTKDSDADVATGNTTCYTLGAGENNLTVDAGLKNAPPQVGSIGDKVWFDTNGNGVQDGGEAGINNVTVKLYDCNNTLISTTTTDANGNYLFSNLPTGDYYVKFVLPSGMMFTTKDAGGNDAQDSDADETTGKTACYTLGAGENNLTVDAGLKNVPPQVGSIGDKVWFDTNGNGVQDGGEAGVDDVTVKLYNCNNTLISTTTTNSNGNYLFSNLPAGDYYVKFVLPSGMIFTTKDAGGNDALDSDADETTGKTACYTLAAGENNLTIDAGLKNEPVVPASIGDKVWEDTDKDGIQDAGENGLANVTVKLYDCMGVLQTTTTTDANGNYSFTNLVPGDYYVRFTLPTGYSFSPSSEGNNTSLDSDADETTGKTECTTLTSGENDMTRDAGMFVNAADLEVTKTANTTTINCGASFAYTVTVKNNGAAIANSVIVSDVLPVGLVFASATASQGAYNSATGEWTVGTLNNGATATLTIGVTVDCNALNLSNIDLGAATPFNVFVLQNITQPSADTEGKLAVGGNASLGGYSVGDKLANSNGTEDVLVVGGNLIYTSGRVYNGNVVFGGTSNLPQTSVSIEEGTLRQEANVIDFAAATTYLEGLSTQLGAYTANGTTTFQWGTLNLSNSDPFFNIFSVNAADLNAAHTVEINVPNGATVLVNIHGTTVNWHGGLFVNGTSIRNVIYNFPEATNITISGIDVKGSFLAPFADLTFPAGIITGQTIVKSMTGSGQFNLSPFIGNVPSNQTIVNVASVISSSAPDPNTANNTSSASVSFSANNTGGGSGNTNWQQIGNFPAGQVVTTLESDGQGTIYAGTASGYIYKSTNNSTWTHINADVYSGAVWALKLTSNGNLLAATVTGVYVGSNYGTNWALSSLQYKDTRNLKADDNGKLFAGTWGFGVYTSTDNGATWSAASNGLGSHLIVTGLTIAPDNSVYAGTFSGGVFKTIDQGANWTAASPAYQYIWTMAATTDGKLFAGTYGDGLYRSNDNGSSWTKTFFPGSFVYELRIDAGNNIFATSYSGGVFLSTNNGDSWTNLGLGGSGLSTLLIVPNGSVADGSASSMLYTGTTNGAIYMASSNVTGVQTESGNVPSEFALGQNYPNPFNPSTTINVAIAKAGNYRMQVFDITGQIVATLMDGDYAAGNFKVEFSASNIPSGIYFYRLTGNDVNLTKKMILMK